MDDVLVWRGNDSELLCSLKGHTDWVSDVVVNDDNSILCSASHDGGVRRPLTHSCIRRSTLERRSD